MTKDEARADFADFFREGTPPDVADEFDAWHADKIVPAGTFEIVEAVRSLAAPPAPAGPSRADLQAQIAKHEADMRAEPGSDAWKNYWQRGGSADCLDARRALATAPSADAQT